MLTLGVYGAQPCIGNMFLRQKASFMITGMLAVESACGVFDFGFPS